MMQFALKEISLVRLVEHVDESIKSSIEDGADDLRREWGYELYRQQLRFHRGGQWAPLDAGYAKRKAREFGQSSSEVRYNTTLRRTGRMLAGYVNGITINTDTSTTEVSMPYPDGELGIRARAHQGVIPRPKGVVARPFDLEGFTQVALDVFTKALNKAING